MGRLWTREQEDFLCDTLDRLATKPFASTAKATTEVHLHFENESEQGECPFTQAQIANKIRHYSRSLNIKADVFLKNWALYAPRVREKIENRRRSAPKQQESKAGSNSNPDEDAAQGKEVEVTPVVSEPEGEQDSFQYSPDAPTASPLSDFTSVSSVQLQSEADTGLSAPRYSIELEEWEYKLFTHLRRHLGDKGYVAPLPERDIQHILQKTMKLIDESFVQSLLGSRVVMPTSSRLTEESLELTRLLIDSTRGDPTERRLKALLIGPHVSERTLFCAYTAAAIYQWALKPFDENLRHIPPSDCEECRVLDIGEEYKHHIARDVTARRANQHLDKFIKPKLPALASQIQEKLYNVFISISVPSARLGWSENQGFEFQERKLRQWQERVEDALLQLLNARATMAKCPLLYGFRLPAVGNPFEVEWMEAAHPENTEFTSKDRVYLCLRPAIFAHNPRDNTQEVLISPALVMVEGYEASLTIT